MYRFQDNWINKTNNKLVKKCKKQEAQRDAIEKAYNDGVAKLYEWKKLQLGELKERQQELFVWRVQLSKGAIIHFKTEEFAQNFIKDLTDVIVASDKPDWADKNLPKLIPQLTYRKVLLSPDSIDPDEINCILRDLRGNEEYDVVDDYDILTSEIYKFDKYK